MTGTMNGARLCWHTVGADGLPQARTVVLRQAHSKLGQLQTYTDSRSPKVAEMTATQGAMLTFWSKRLGWQLRVQATTEVQQTGAEVDAIWARVSQSPQRVTTCQPTRQATSSTAPALQRLQTPASRLRTIWQSSPHKSSPSTGWNWLAAGIAGHSSRRTAGRGGCPDPLCDPVTRRVKHLPIRCP